jgi:hypothetical protein
MLRRGKHASPRPKSRKARRFGRAVPLAMALVMAMGAIAVAHNTTVNATISPPSGTVITTAETQLSGTFGPGSGCGLTTAIDVTPSAGTISGLTQSCTEVNDDAIWTWQATWSDYGPGEHTVTAEFLATHGQDFVHDGEIVATYNVVPSNDCESGENHGQYVSCVAHNTESAPGKGQTVSAAARNK